MTLHYAFQTDEKLYLVMDFLNGGELFFHLRKAGHFDEDRIRFYASEIILALEYLHKQGIIYRDLKPENILLDSEGHIKITDFGLSKQGIFNKNLDRTFTICGTPEYLAPEIITGKGHEKAVDFWSLGTMLFEMHVGYPPFMNKNKIQLMKTIATNKVDFTRLENTSSEFQDLVRKLLRHDPSKRLGSQSIDEIKRHRFFKGQDWSKLERKEQPAPFVPMTRSLRDTNNIDKSFLKEKPVDSPIDT